MISIPHDFQNNSIVDPKFRHMIEFFNRLEEDLSYPNCDGKEDAKRILAQAQNELIIQGFL